MKVSRLNSIEQYVISRETVSIDELCEVFGVSKNTIRRDLNELEMRGHITKVYGGVTRLSIRLWELPSPRSAATPSWCSTCCAPPASPPSAPSSGR